jgi:hypothetical protein
MYNVHIDKHGNEGTLFMAGISSINKNKVLIDEDIGMIISKILSLTPDISWTIQ